MDETLVSTDTTTGTSTTGGVTKSGDIGQLVDDFFKNFKTNSTARAELVEPPQIEGSTVIDWFQFFIQNGFIFIVWLLAMVWVCYVIFYHSRVMGYLVTKIVNYLFVKTGYFKVGSFSFASISGKIMFRDFVYVTEDYSIRVQDGWIAFCYWIPYVYRNAKTEDLSNSDARVHVFLNGFEIHIYNRSQTYSELEKIFNLPSKIFGAKDREFNIKKQADEERRQKIIKTMNESAAVNELKQSIWRDLIPLTKIEIASGRFVFGNHLMPSTLSISFEESNFTYSSRPAVSSYDLFTHILKGKAENLQVVLVPSPKYSGFLNDEPPRFMGDGFIVFRSNKIDIYYYQDEPGLILEETINELDNTPPAWGMVIKCGKGTDFSYGPWADRQREYLYNFFFPPTFQIVPISEKPKVGELRQFETFDVRLSTLHEAKIDILFSKNKETNALHLNAGPGTYLELSVPWICGETGYTSHILGQILHLDATTSLQFRPLISSETLEIDVKIFYPRIWNAHQDWNCKITACKATIDLIFAHKIFIQDLIDDWSDRNRPDILKFVPYTWRISVVIKEFELLILANEHNWIDCSTGLNDENCKIAVCGENFDMAFDLPFTEFLPPKLAIKIWIQGECLEGAFYLPECSINRDVIELLQRYSTIMARDGSKKSYLQNFGQSRKWKNVVSRENHWHECMSAPIVALSITYDFYPIPNLGNANELKISEITTPELEEILLSPLRPESRASLLKRQHAQSDSIDFDPTTLAPDVMTVELEIGPMNLAIFGSLFIFLWNIKENYMGESQVFSEMSANFFDDKFEQTVKKRSDTTTSEKKEKGVDFEPEPAPPAKPFDGRLYRPFEVIVSATLHEIQGHLVQCTNQSELYSPLVYVEKLCFELKKGFAETRLQLIISPAVLQVEDALERKSPLNEAWKEGFLTLSSLQFRGHAMFSNLDRPIESETLEYAWLVEVEVGEIGGRLTIDHLRQILIPLENFFFQILQADIGLQPPNPFKKCLHDQLQNECSHSDIFANRLCPYSEDLKYRMVRVIVNQVDLFLLESNVALNVIVPTVRMATCNLHIMDTIDGFTLLMTNATIRQFVSLSHIEKENDNINNVINEQNWLEISSMSTGPLFIDAALSSSAVDNYSVSQVEFIKKHDLPTKRLWFLWSDLHRDKCSCTGNTSFFGCNLVGQEFFSFTNCHEKQGEKSPSSSKSICYGGKLHNHSELFNPGYGESLLHPGNFLLDINSPLMTETSRAILNTSKYTNNKSSKAGFFKDKSPSVQNLPLHRPLTLSPKDFTRNGIKSSMSIETTFPTSPTTEHSSKSLAGRPASSIPERFFSAEDISYTGSKTGNKAELTSPDSTHSYKTISNGDNLPFSSTSSGTYLSPQGIFSADDVTSPSRYYTAMGDNMTSSQKFTSANTSNATLPKFHSLSSDSSPTLVSTDRDFSKSKDGDTLNVDLPGSPGYKSKNFSRRSSMTLSTNSFISAVSEHDDDLDLDLVDLRNQLEKPIFTSPLLMSSYTAYMSQYSSQHLDIPPPFPLLQNARIANYFGIKSSQAIHFERLIYEYRHEWKPKFVLRRAGFSETKILKSASNQMDEESFYSTYFIPGIVTKKNTIERAKDVNFLTDNEVIFSQRKPTVTFSSENPRSRTGTMLRDENESGKARAETLVDSNILGSNLVRDREDSVDNIQIYIQFREIELKVSPMTLDVMARFVTSIDQVASHLHPGTLLNHLSLTCQCNVQDKNSLKKEKLLYLGQLHMRAWKLLKQRQNMKHLNRSISFSDRASRSMHESSQNPANTLVSNNLEVDKKVLININADIGRVSVNSIQASIVEEIISFSALDRVKDLTCVSVLNLCFDQLNFQFSRTFRRQKILHIVMDQSSVSNLSFTEKALMTRFFTRKPKKVYSEIETFSYETTDAFIDEMKTDLSLSNIQLQLSRLVNSPDVLKDATLTVIPYSRAKVDFVYSGPLNSDEMTDSMKIKRRKYIKTVMQNSSSTSSTSSRKNLLKRQSRILPDAELKEGTSSTGLNTKLADSYEDQYGHFNRFIMFELGLEKLSATFSNTSSCNALKLKLDEGILSTGKVNLVASNSNLNNVEAELLEIPSKPIGSSSVKGEINKVWFHFASPPKLAPNAPKNEFTRHDWHLLSCAVPLAIAWVSAIDRMVFIYGSCQKNSRQRITSSIACLMSKTLNDYLQQKDAQLIKPLHNNSKQLTRIFSSMAKTYQEDPSIHLINVLRSNLKKSFQTTAEFEAFFSNLSLLPNLKELERGIVVLLFQWKDLIHIPGSNVQAMFYRNQQAAKPTTKSQLLALFEEKTRQLTKNSTDPTKESSTKIGTTSGDPTIRTRLMTASGGDNDSVVLNGQPDTEAETTKLLHRPFNDHLSDSNGHGGREDIENRADVSSTHTRVTSSEQDGKRHRANSRRPNRVQFMSRSHAKAMYDQFLGLPLVRNLSTVCHSGKTGITNSINRLRRGGNRNRSPREQQELKTLDSTVQNETQTAPASPISGQENQLMLNKSPAAVEPATNHLDVRLNIPDYDPYDSTQMNGRFSSYSNYGDKKDLYWWMVKQQDYMKNVANNLATTFRDYTKPNANVHYLNLDQSEATPNQTVTEPNINAETQDTIESALPHPNKEYDRESILEQGAQKGAPETSAKKPEEELAAGLNKQSPENEVCLAFDVLIDALDLSKACEPNKLSSTDFGVFGTRISLAATFRQLSIDIDEAEVDISKNMFTLSKMNSKSFSNHFHLETHLPAFVCENLTIETILLKRMSPYFNESIITNLKDFENHSSIGLSNISSNISHILQDLEKKSQFEDGNILNLDALVVLGFGIQLGHVIQRINLPLLRLIHQFSAMYENVVQTRFEMRSNRATYTHNDLDKQHDENDDADEDELSLNSLSTTSSLNSEASMSLLKNFPNSQTPINKDECVITIEEPNEENEPNAPNVQADSDNKDESETEAKASVDPYSQIEKCWRTIFLLLDEHRRNKLRSYLNNKQVLDLNNPNNQDINGNPLHEQLYVTYPNLDFLVGCPVIVAGSGNVKQTNLVAMLSTLKLEGELSNFGFNLTHQDCFRREKPKQNVTFSSIIQLKRTLNTSFDLNVEKTKISLFEDAHPSMYQEPCTSTSQPQQQLVVSMAIGKSSLGLTHQNENEREIMLTLEQLSNYDSYQFHPHDPESLGAKSSRNKYTNSARVLIGAIEIDIPQHPVALHGMMTRSGRQLSTTLQELRSSRQPSRLSRQQTMTQSNTGNMTDSQMPSSPHAHNSSMSSSTHQSSDHAIVPNVSQPSVSATTNVMANKSSQPESSTQHGARVNFPTKPPTGIAKERSNQNLPVAQTKSQNQAEQQQMLLPFTIEFDIVMESFTIKASLLPSLRAQYRIGKVTSTGYAGTKAKFVIDVVHHSLCFNTKIEPCINTDINLPTEAAINLPGIHMNAEYMEETPPKKPSHKHTHSDNSHRNMAFGTDSFTDGIVYRKGNYLNMIAEIGAFEHCLTTDLLNHLLFVQKVFMKEVNEVVQKMSRTEPNSFFILQDKSDAEEDNFDMEKLGKQLASASSRVILFSLHLRMTGIQITATTPTNSAVRFETGTIDLQLSNRVMNMTKRDLNLKMFLRVQLDFNLALGQLIRNALFEEAEPDFQQLAYFKTRISMRNALQGEMQSTIDSPGAEDEDEDKEVVLLTLTRPLVYVQPLALDKAVLVWINYKNAYEYWNEQRANLNFEVIQATQQVIDRVQPLTQSFSSSQSLGTLFLQLNVIDFGICLPISSSVISFPNQTRIFDTDLKDALVLTLESTRISACSRGSLVSKAQFSNLCIRFADDFETNLDDWKPNLADVSIKNLCIVSEGTYDICSRTISHPNLHKDTLPQHVKTHMPSHDEESVADAKWILNVSWKMDGFDIHVDTSIGKHISALFKTMTAIAGDEDEDDEDDEDDDDDDEEIDDHMIQSKDVTQVDSVSSAKKEARSVDDLINPRPKIVTSQSTDSPNKTFLDDDVSGDAKSPKRWSTVQQSEDVPSQSRQQQFTKSRSTTIKDLKEMNKRRSRNIEKELNEQAKVIHDLRQLGASSQTIQQETQRYQELEAAAFNHFRRGVIKKLKRPSKNSSNSIMGVKDFSKTRAYSTSLYSYDESKLSETQASKDAVQGKRASAEESSKAGEKVPLAKTRSSTISIPQLKYDDNTSLVTLSSGDETSSYTENESPPSPHSPADSLDHSKPFKFPSGDNSKQSESDQHTTPSSTLLELPKVFGDNSQSPPGQMGQSSMPTIEPKIDFELDVKIFFNSGKCVLHTKDQQTKEAEQMAMHNRNFSATDMATNNNNNNNSTSQPVSVSPTLSAGHALPKTIAILPTTINKSRSANKLSKFINYGSNSYRRDYHQSAGLNPDFTVFLIPGLDIKLHYSSKTISTEKDDDKDKEQVHFKNPSFPQETKRTQKEILSATNSLTRQKCAKRAFLFAWITLSSIPDEIFISPHILDFFEEALKPLPVPMSAPASANATLSSMQSQQHQRMMNAASSNDSSSNLADTPTQYVYYASFPVDVIVFFHFQPTIIRLGCLPVSRVECLLHLPSIDLVMSSKRSDFDLDGNLDSPSSPQSLQQLSSKTFKNMNKSFSADSQAGTICSAGGGLSITGCLADFSLYIFHPYGGQKNKASLNLDKSSSKQPNSKSSYSMSDRKDSLSLQVEFVKINISRSRKVILGESLTQSISFSAICDIGTATFKYDVRRLNEILAFPKAWYRKAIWKKIFIGENTVNAIFSDGEEDPEVPNSRMAGKETDDQSDDYLDDSSSATSLSNEYSLDSSSDMKKHRKHRKHGLRVSRKHKRPSHMIAIVNNPWETLVLLTVNFSTLNISMNMGNVMGNANWLTRNLMCDGSISIDSSGHKKYRFGICLKNSTLDAKGGIVGGIVELSDIRTEINVREDRNKEPQHKISCSLHTIENRIDYMGTSILMTRISDLSASFHDEWRVTSQFETPRPSTTDETPSPNIFPTKRPASIYVHGCLKWDQMQVLMSKSTSPDFTKIISKLEEFFTQQFHSGKRVFDALHPSSKATSSSKQNICSLAHKDSLRNKTTKRTQSVSSANSNNTTQSESTKTPMIDTVEQVEPIVSHHRHWQRALQFVTGIYHNSLIEPPRLAREGIILGGTTEVRAQNISLACFYGVNFRSKSWAVFSLRQPSITFMTEAQNVRSEESEEPEFSTHVVQNLSLVLGRGHSSGSDSNPTDLTSRTMATVSKISRTVLFPPQFRHLHEWFHYAFSPVEIDEVSRFPIPSPDNVEFDAYGVPIESLTSTPQQMRNNQAASADRKIKSTSEFNYKEEMIFAFPSMQLELKTEHLQMSVEPLLTDPKPQVLCSFVSDFDDHIYVAVDAEAYFFLHDLISSYIHESNKMTDSLSRQNTKEEEKTQKSEKGKTEQEVPKDAKAIALTEKKKSEDEFGNDFREFICKVWHLEPTVRLHSWASKNIDPYGVDYILQRLGFNQARTTIPKWIQRSTMDGIDKLISVFVYHMILKSQEENPKSPQLNSGQKE